MTVHQGTFARGMFVNGEYVNSASGKTLLGADNKSGVAEIMTAAEHLLAHPCSDAAAGTHNNSIAPFVGQKLTKFGRSIDWSNHDCQARSGIDGYGLSGTGDGHKPRTRAQRPTRCQSRRSCG